MMQQHAQVVDRRECLAVIAPQSTLQNLESATIVLLCFLDLSLLLQLDAYAVNGGQCIFVVDPKAFLLVPRVSSSAPPPSGSP